MPTYEVSAPDGQVYEVDAPEGTDEQTALAHFQAQYPKLKRAADAKAFAGRDVKDMGAFMRGVGGAKHAFDRAAFGLKDVFTDLSDEDKRQLAQGKAFTEEAGTAGKVGEIGTDVGLVLAPGGAVTRGLRAVTGAARTLPRALARLGGEVAAGAGMGAVQAMPEERAQGAAWGAGGGAAGAAANRLLGGAVRPLVTEEAEALMRQGIQPTAGQSVGGAIGAIEERASSLPLVGSAVKRARDRAVNEFNERVIQQAAPGVTGMGDDAVLAARDAISARYQSALAAMPPNFNIDAAPIIQAAVSAVDDPARALNRQSRDFVLDYVERNLLQRQTSITPEIAKRIESDLGAATSRLLASSDSEQRAIGGALRDIQTGWRDSLTAVGNSYGTGAGDALREADAAWRAFLPIDDAASRAGSQGSEEAAGRFTPKVLRRSIERADKSMNNRATRASIGNVSTPFNRVNTMTRQGEQVLSNRYPDSGTAGRLGTAATLGAGAGSIAAGSVLPAAVAGGAAALGHLGSTRVGQQFATQGLRPAIDALVARGIPIERAAQMVEEFGPDVVLAMTRGAAPQQGAPYAPQQ